MLISYYLSLQFRLVDSEALTSKLIVPLDILVGNVPLHPRVDPNPSELATETE